jgi:hypothetical protein
MLACLGPDDRTDHSRLVAIVQAALVPRRARCRLRDPPAGGPQQGAPSMDGLGFTTRARGRREPGQKPRSHTGPVREIAVVVRRHRTQPSASSSFP